MNINYWGPNMEEYESSKGVLTMVRSFRQYYQIKFTNDEADDKLRLEYVSMEIKNLVHKNDTLTGFLFSLNNQTKYWQIVKIIEICTIEKVNYIFNENNIWVYNLAPDNAKTNPAPVLYDCIQIDRTYLNKKASSEEWHLHLMRTFSLYIIMLTATLTLFITRTRFQKQTID